MDFMHWKKEGSGQPSWGPWRQPQKEQENSGAVEGGARQSVRNRESDGKTGQ